ncbi:hypothetical protein JKY72_06270, partial [Candidatus Gracilibacteria bacterium]|nr:hypothetical protein [Candidatus Gracilibacteria bacterium]
MSKFTFKNRSLSMLVLLTLFVSSVIPAPVAYAFVDAAKAPSSTEVVYDLVAVVVDKELKDNSTNYVGLSANKKYSGLFSSLAKSDLMTRVERYAEDLVDNYELTDVELIVFDKKKDSVEDLASALENLWRNGSTGNNRLRGVVLVGDVPLPVVNKGGNRYVSVFPYTDFSEKAYRYSAEKNSFVQNGDVSFPQAEIWHGVIASDEEENLARFFDKNHLYY